MKSVAPEMGAMLIDPKINLLFSWKRLTILIAFHYWILEKLDGVVWRDSSSSGQGPVENNDTASSGRGS
jgi:hypothetical protein